MAQTTAWTQGEFLAWRRLMAGLSCLLIASFVSACDPKLHPSFTFDNTVNAARVGDTDGDGDIDANDLPVGTGRGQRRFACAADAVPPVAPLQRLTMAQTRNVIVDGVNALAGPDRAEEIAEQVFASLTITDVAPLDPVNRFRTTYRRFDRNVDDRYLDVIYNMALQVAESLVANDRAALLSPCTDGVNEDCLRQSLRDIGTIWLRRPPSDEELTRWLNLYGDTNVSDDAALRDVVGVIIANPHTTYAVENGDDNVEPDADGVVSLSSTELAARLSLVVWDTAPDAVLRAAAADGSLLQEAVYAAEVDRLLDDPRAAASVLRFVEDWLRLDGVADFTAQADQPGFQVFGEGYVPSDTIRADVQQELRDFAMRHGFLQPGPLRQLLTSTEVMPRSPELAQLYGLSAPWDGQSDPPTLDERPGLLTRVGMLATGGIRTRPIHKGVVTMDQILCLALATPPPGAATVTIDLPQPYSVRDHAEALTEVGSCLGCHATINPFGYATENFDGLGRLRTVDRSIDLDTGEDFGAVAIRTDGEVLVAGELTHIADASELMQTIADSGDFEACVSRHFFRHLSSRVEIDAADSCSLAAMENAAQEGNLKSMMRAFVMARAFRSKTLGEQ